MKIHIIFQPRVVDEGRAPNELIFVEVNDESGKSIDAGEWITDGDHEALTIDCDDWAETDHARLLQKLDDVTAIAISPGNADHNEYLRGMANGLILAQSIFKDIEPEFILPADRKTFVIPDGFEAVTDHEGRATGELRKLP